MAQVIGGAERVLRAQALGLAARGHQVRVLTRLGPTGAPAYAVEAGVAETRFAVNRRHALTFFVSSIRHARHAYAALVRAVPPDVVVIHQALPGLSILDCLGRVPAVYVCHSLAYEEFETRHRPPVGALGQAWYRWQSRLRKWTEHVVLSRARRVVVLSDFMQQRVEKAYGAKGRRAHSRGRAPLAERIRVIPGGVDTQAFSPVLDRRAVRASLGVAADAFVLLTVRNLVPRMGLEALIEAAARLRQEIPQLQVLIGGNGPLRAALGAQVAALGLHRCVQLLGFVPEGLLPDYYRAADLFVLPTVQLEGFGLVTVEALASGTPVFGTRIGATEEILGQLEPSLLSSGADAASLAAGIRALYRRFTADPSARAQLAKAGRALVLRHFTWVRHCERIESALGEVLQQD